MMTNYYKKLIHTLTGFLIVVTLTGCHSYYKAISIKTQNFDEKLESISKLKAQDRYFILRSGNKAYYMSGITLSSDQTMLTAILDSLPRHHRLHLRNGIGGRNRYNKAYELDILPEVHLFIPGEDSIRTGAYTLSLDKVQKIEVIEKDKGRTTKSHIIGGVGYTLGALAVLGIIVAQSLDLGN